MTTLVFSISDSMCCILGQKPSRLLLSSVLMRDSFAKANLNLKESLLVGQFISDFHNTSKPKNCNQALQYQSVFLLCTCENLDTTTERRNKSSGCLLVYYQRKQLLWVDILASLSQKATSQHKHLNTDSARKSKVTISSGAKLKYMWCNNPVSNGEKPPSEVGQS